MLKKYPQFTFAFAIIFFAELIAVTNNLAVVRLFTKPIITISLMLFLYFAIKRESRFTKKVIIGLFFSLLGDIFLMFVHTNQLFFMMGLGAFLIAHLFYIAAFYLDSTNKMEVERRYVLPIFLVFGFFCLAYYYLLRPYLGDMNVPVLVYSFVITMMGIMAALRYGKTNFKSFTWILMGAIFFIVSDSILAYNKFVERMEIGDLLVMSTYMAAQFLITMGTVERKYVKKN
ncbi:MAG: lysoplasmalogenase [Pedobacter sp.]|uniref:lysoplasmalogenase n=1 Tax=Pedobacter sp. TaxID=1411316 RepID=UPI002806A002|nr:lysoplasmalogenase [Pedobacter sp.]MDQ8003424.1 lysoplasmalogenase [Pedobacter sp.]